MNTSGDRLSILLRECHLSATDFAANRKVTPQHVNNWFKRGIPMARMEEVAELLSVNARWLRSGEGPKHPGEARDKPGMDGIHKGRAERHGAREVSALGVERLGQREPVQVALLVAAGTVGVRMMGGKK